MPDRRAFLHRLAAVWAATVAQRPAPTPRVIARTTALFQQPDGRRNLVRVAVTGVDAPAARARLLDRRGALVGTAGLLPTEAQVLVGELWVPLTEPTDFRIDVEVGRDRVARGTTRLIPPRRWTVHVLSVPGASTSPASLEAMLRRLRVHPEHGWTPADARGLLRFLADQPAAARDALLQALRAGQVALPPFFGRPITELLDHATLVSLLEPAARLAREYGLAYGTALTVGGPGLGPTTPLLLAASGVRYLASIVGQGDTANLRPPGGESPPVGDPFRMPQLFWWAGPAGARVLCWRADISLDLGRLGWATGPREAAALLSDLLQHHPGLQPHRWPYDVVLLPLVAGDPEGAGDAALANIDEVRRRYAFPRLLPGRGDEFFRAVERRSGAPIATWRGHAGRPCDSEQLPDQPAAFRQAQLAARAAELLALWDTRIELPGAAAEERRRRRADERRAMWRALLRAGSPPYDTPDPLPAAWATARRQIAEALDRIGSRNDRGRGRVVFNASTWDRTDLVRIPDGAGWTLEFGGQPLPTVDLPDGSALAMVRNVPGLGYLAYAVRPRAATLPKDEGPALDAAAGGFAVRVDATTGAIASLVGPDSRERVKPTPWTGLNQIGHAADAPAAAAPAPPYAGFVAARREALPGIGVRLVVERRLEPLAELQSTITLYDELPWVDIENRFVPPRNGQPLVLSVAFPLAFTAPAVDAEIPLGRARVTGDAGPWHCHMHWVWITEGEDGVLWSAPDTPLFGLNPAPADTRVGAPTDGTLFARAPLGHTPTDDSQAGRAIGEATTVRFRLSLLAPGDAAEPVRRGWAACDPLHASAAYRNAEPGPLIGRERAIFLADRGAHVLSATLANDGKSAIVRLLDVAGYPRSVGVWPGAWTYAGAQRTNLVDMSESDLTVEPDGRVGIHLDARGVGSARLFTPRAGAG